VRSPARLLVLASLALIAVWGTGQTDEAKAEDGLAGSLTEQHHGIDVVPGIELTTLEVTRTFFNPTFDHQQLGLLIDLPCEAIVDGLELRGPDDARGRAVWVPGKLIETEQANERFFDFRFADDGQAMDGDTMAVLSRADGCKADLDLFPVPPLRERSIRYRIRIPSSYAEGRYQIQLPAFVLEFEGAQLHVADPPSGFEMAVDGRPNTGSTNISGSLPHTLTLTPLDDRHARVSLAALDLRKLGASEEAQSVIAAELDLPMDLVDLPPVRRVVVAIDASHSLDGTSRAYLQSLASAYLDALALARPDAGVEVLEFDRHVRRTFGEFLDPQQASKRLARAMIDSNNGSEPGLALASARELLAEARQPGEDGVDWVLLLSDLELREQYSLSAELEAAASSEVRMHVIRPGHGDHALTPLPMDDPWMAIARATGGAHFEYSALQSIVGHSGAELLEPNRVWDLRLIHHDARGRTSVIPLADELRVGESTRWLERLNASALESVTFEAFTWAAPLTWSAKASRQANARWAARLTAGDRFMVELEDAESQALAEFAGTITPWTSMLAEARFEGRSPLGQMWGRGGSWSGRSSHTRCGFGSTHHGRRVTLDLSVLEAEITHALGECRDLGAASVAFEILDREIVMVESSDACAREAIWQLDLGAWPSFGHPLVQFAFDESGVHQLQLTALDGYSSNW
jgi:hypothetical protein